MSALRDGVPKVGILENNYLNAVAPPFETLMNDKNAKQDCATVVSSLTACSWWYTYSD